jgi:protein TonB
MPHPQPTPLPFAFGLALLAAGCATVETPAPPSAVATRPVENRMARTRAETYDISKVSKPPRAIPRFQARPQYPLELRRASMSGEGVVDFIVDTDGMVQDAIVVRATDVRFGEAALAAVVQWRFEPAEINGVPVNCHMQVPITFTVDAR